jgi:hypothetical protein
MWKLKEEVRKQERKEEWLFIKWKRRYYKFRVSDRQVI